MGKLSREKGHDFERQIARDLRALWPGADVHRSSQADRARESDVVIEGNAPALAKDLWLELQDAREPNPRKKLIQAQGDVRRSSPGIPVVVWHQLAKRSINVSMLAGDYILLALGRVICDDRMITLDWEDFKSLLKELPMPKSEAA